MQNTTQHSNNTQADTKPAKAKPSFWTYFAIIMTIIGGVIVPQLKATEVVAVPRFQVEVMGAGGALPESQPAQAKAIYQQLATLANATLVMNTSRCHFMMLDEPEWFIAQLRLALQE